MPKGGFGNLIALPLQKWPRENGCSVFVDADLRPYPDQWAFLASIQPMAAHDIEPTILRATGGVHPLDVTFIDDEDLATPGSGQSTSTKKLAGPMPKSLTVTLANLIYFEKAQLPQALANRLIRWRRSRTPSSTRPRRCGCRCGTSRASSAAPRTTRSTSPCRAAASMPRRTCCATTASPATCGTSASAVSRSMCPSSALCAGPGGRSRRNAASRRRRAVRSDRLWQDGHRRRDDRAPGRQHPGAGASHRTAQAMAGTSAGVSGCRQGRGRHHRRRQGQAHRQDRHRRDAVAVPQGEVNPWSRTTAR
jgi:hypothetical protein